MTSHALKERCRAVLEYHRGNRMYPGAVLGVCDGQEEWFLSCGRSEYGQGFALGADSLWDLASITKTLPTAHLALMAMDRGICTADDCVADVLPLRGRFAREIRLHHLLTHTLSYRIPLSSMKNRSATEIFAALDSWDFPVAPGREYAYCNATSILLGRFLEARLGASLSELGREWIFSPLGMAATGFWQGHSAFTAAVPAEVDSWRGGPVRGEVHDESAWVLTREYGCVGSAGLFSTARNVLCWLRDFLAPQSQLLSRSMRENIPAPRYAATGKRLALGWEIGAQRFMGARAPANLLGKTGFTGTCIWADQRRRRGAVLLTNTAWPRRKSDVRRINAVRAEIADVLFA
ncbi:MAG: serine hydrolase domain-containing protein [Fibrobacterota bacterium]